MRRSLYCAATGAALLALCAAPGAASASTITLVSFSGFNLTATQQGPQAIGGSVISPFALDFATDTVTFYLTPAGNSTITVQDLANTTFPNEVWEITGPGGFNTGPLPANNVPTVINIPLGGVGNDYVFALSSDAPATFGASIFSLTTATPLPGALGLFAGGLGLLGFTGLRKRKKESAAIA